MDLNLGRDVKGKKISISMSAEKVNYRKCSFATGMGYEKDRCTE